MVRPAQQSPLSPPEYVASTTPHEAEELQQEPITDQVDRSKRPSVGRLPVMKKPYRPWLGRVDWYIIRTFISTFLFSIG